jgi:xylulokinase
MTKTQPKLIGIDVGTTAVKAALFDGAGHVLKSCGERYSTQRPAPGHVEQNASDWLLHVAKALAELGGDVQAVGLCSQVNTHVFVDDKGEPLMPAFTWADTRCAAVAAELDAQVKPEDKLRWWGAPLPIDASHVLARMAFVARHHADVWAKTRWVMAPKDFCIFKLTAEVTADPMTCFGLVDQQLKLIPELMALMPGAEKRLPPISGFTTSAGRIGAGLPCAGVPMVVGAMDAWSGLLGAGVSEQGQGLYLSGTSEILGIVSETKVPTAGVIAFAKCEGITLHAAPTQSGGASVEWIARLLGKSAAEISALAAQADLRTTPLFLPHLEGERAPLWDAGSRGSFAGLTSSTGAPELARAVLEGVAYSARLAFDALEASAARKPDVIHHSGGGSESGLWCQIRADVLGRPLCRTAMRDAGVLGAALMAGVGTQVFPSLHQAARDFVLYDQTFEPDAREADRHATRFTGYKALYEQLKPLQPMWRS